MEENLTLQGAKDAIGNLMKGGFINPQSPEPTDVTPEVNADQVGEDSGFDISDAGTDDLVSQIQGTIAGMNTGADDSGLQDIESAIIDSEQTLGGLTQEQNELEGQAGIPDLQAQRRDINSQMAELQASLTAGITDEEGRVVPMGVITGRSAQLQKQAQAKAQSLQAIDSALQGNIETAQSRIDTMMENKYSAVETRLNVLDRALASAERTFTTKEQRLANKRQAEINLLQNQIEVERDKESNATKNIMTAISNGFDPSRGAELMRKLNQGEITPSDVVDVVGGKLRDPIDVINEQIKQAELDVARKANEKVSDGVWTEKQADTVNKLTKQLRGEPAYKNMSGIKDGYSTVVVGYEQQSGFGDIAMVNGFQRIIDPGATVREGDIKTQEEAVSFVASTLNIPRNKLQGDKFPDEARDAIKAAADAQYKIRVDDFEKQTKSRYENIIKNNPEVSSLGLSYEDIGDSFAIDQEPSEPSDPTSEPLGATVMFEDEDGNPVEYIKVGENSYEQVNK